MPSSIAVQSSLPSSHAARRALRGLENTTPSLFSPSKLKVRTTNSVRTRIMWVNEKSSAQFVYVRLSVWLGWPQASPREPLRCHISSLVIVETLKVFPLKKRKPDRRYYALWSPVNENSTLRDHISKSREIASHYCCILCHIRSNLTPQASRTRCSGSTVPAHCLLAHAANRPLRPVVHQRERSTRCPRRRPRAAQAGQKMCGDGTVAGLRR